MKGNGIEGRLTVVFDRPLVLKAVFSGDQGAMTVTPMHRPNQYTIRTERQEYIETVPYDGDDFCGEIMHFNALVHSGRKEKTFRHKSEGLCIICQELNVYWFSLLFR